MKGLRRRPKAYETYKAPHDVPFSVACAGAQCQNEMQRQVKHHEKTF